MMDQKTADAIRIYQQVIDDVIEYVSGDWKNEGNDIRLLEKAKDLWVYRALKDFEPSLQEPQGFKVERNATPGMSMDEIMSKIFGGIENYSNQQQQQQETKEEDDDDGFDDVEDDDNVNPQEEESAAEDKVDVDDDIESSESDDDFANDPEIAALITPIQTDDQIICHYTEKKEKSSKTMVEFKLSDIHCYVGGKPFFVKTGTLTTRNNKEKKVKDKRKK